MPSAVLTYPLPSTQSCTLPHPFFPLRSASWGSPEDEPPGWVWAPHPPPLFRNSLSFVGLEKSHICSASGIPHSIIQHTKSTGAGFTHKDIIRPLTWNLSALWQPVFPNYSLIYFITLWSSLCQASGTGAWIRLRPGLQGARGLVGRPMCKHLITGM